MYVNGGDPLKLLPTPSLCSEMTPHYIINYIETTPLPPPANYPNVFRKTGRSLSQ